MTRLLSVAFSLLTGLFGDLVGLLESLIVDHGGVSEPEEFEPSYEELAALVVGLAARVETMEVATPLSMDSIRAKAERRPR